MTTLSTHILDISTGKPAAGVTVRLVRNAAGGRETIFPCAQIDFVIAGTAGAHFHLPFLIAPGGWSTYRGS